MGANFEVFRDDKAVVKSQDRGQLFRGKDRQTAGVIGGLGLAFALSHVNRGDGVLPGVAPGVRIGVELPQKGNRETRFLASRIAAASRDSP